MKKMFLVTGVCLFLVTAATAQSTQFGIKGGVNVSTIKVSDGDDFDSKAGFHVGGLAHIHLSRHIALQPEIVFSAQGGKNGDLIRRVNYVNVPVMVQYMTNNGFRFQTGPQVGFLTSAKTKFNDLEVDVRDNMRAAELAWTVGAGYLSKVGLGIDARYNFGLTNTNESESPEARNMVFQVGAFYQFHH